MQPHCCPRGKRFWSLFRGALLKTLWNVRRFFLPMKDGSFQNEHKHIPAHWHWSCMCYTELAVMKTRCNWKDYSCLIPNLESASRQSLPLNLEKQLALYYFSCALYMQPHCCPIVQECFTGLDLLTSLPWHTTCDGMFRWSRLHR